LEDGAKDTRTRAAERVKFQLSNYQKPSIDIAIEEALNAYVAEKKSAVPDSFV
jgi:trimethylamine--corrinoid protein Co-methyltransferase